MCNILYENYLFLQIRGLSPSIRGKISSLPRSIAKLRMIFEKSEYSERFELALPKAGPILLKQEIVTLRFVSTLKGSRLSRMKMIIIQMM